MDTCLSRKWKKDDITCIRRMYNVGFTAEDLHLRTKKIISNEQAIVLIPALLANMNNLHRTASDHNVTKAEDKEENVSIKYAFVIKTLLKISSISSRFFLPL